MQQIHSPQQTDTDQQSTSLEKSSPILIYNGIPPVPARLVKRAEEGMYVEMFEFLPAHLSSAKLNLSELKPKLSEVKNIMDWIECFGIYIAIMACSSPQRVADLIGYQSLIISASQKCLASLRQKILFESFSNQEHRVVNL